MENKIPDKIYKLAMLNLICKKLEISDEDIENVAIKIYRNSQ